MQISKVEQYDFDVERRVKEMIAEYGYAQLCIDAPNSARPGFAFTVGLEHAHQTPELLAVGIAPQITAQLFAVCIAGHGNGTLDLASGNQCVSGLVQGCALGFRTAPPALVLKANAARPHRNQDIRALVQVLIPDDAGNFPGDPACDPSVAIAQDADWIVAETAN